MARYRVKDETDLRWNQIRTTLTRELDTQIKITREQMLNEILGDAWEKFKTSLETGEKLQLENERTLFVDSVLRGHISVNVDEPEVEPKAQQVGPHEVPSKRRKLFASWDQ